VRTVVNTLGNRPLASAGAGIATVARFALALILLILIAIILGLIGFGGLLVTSVVGLLLGGGVLTWLLIAVALWIAYVLVGLALVHRVLRRWLTDQTEQSISERTLADIGELALGLLAIVLLTAIPIVGRVVDLVVILLGLGAIALALWQRRPRTAPAT